MSSRRRFLVGVFAVLGHVRIRSRIIYLPLALAVVFLTGCDFARGKVSVVSLSDPRLAPMLQAMAAGDRSSMGFSSIPTNAAVYLVNRPLRRDAAITIFDTEALYQNIYRDIEFRQTATGYVWEYEIEFHPGPRTFKQSDHTAHEEIYIIYDATGISGVTPNKVHVRYEGPNSRLDNGRFPSGKDLTLEEVRPVLEEWRRKR
jgi:hypothetical protein